MPPIQLTLTAANPADVADLINQVIDHPRAQHTVRIDPDTGATQITATVRPGLNPDELLKQIFRAGPSTLLGRFADPVPPDARLDPTAWTVPPFDDVADSSGEPWAASDPADVPPSDPEDPPGDSDAPLSTPDPDLTDDQVDDPDPEMVPETLAELIADGEQVDVDEQPEPDDVADEDPTEEADDPDPAPDVEADDVVEPASAGDEVELVPCPLGSGHPITDRTAALLEANPGREFSRSDVVRALGLPSTGSGAVGQALAKLTRSERIHRPSTGVYRHRATPGTPADQQVDEAPPVNEPLHRKVLALLKSTGDVWDFDDLHDQIDSTNKELMDALKVLKGTGEAVKVSRGRYQAAGVTGR